MDVENLVFTAWTAVHGEGHTWANIEKLRAHKSPLLKELYDSGVATLGYPEGWLARRLVDYVYFYRSDDTRFMNTQQLRLSPLRCLNGTIFFTVVNAMLAYYSDRSPFFLEGELPAPAAVTNAIIKLSTEHGERTSAIVRELFDEPTLELLLDGHKALSPSDEVLEARSRLVATLVRRGFCTECATEVMRDGLDYIERNDDY